MKYTDSSFSVGTGINNIALRKFQGAHGLIAYYEGVVITPLGIVDVYSQEGYTSLVIAWRGRQHRRTYQKEYTPRTLSRLAKQFAKDIVNQNDYEKK